ncbi:MAG: hypothetical protein H7A00_00255 [Hahellaceae bacterium]|nr:hypothetical protein [Hahellaceae bacterium]
MKVIDHAPQWWFLFADNDDLILDVNCNHSFIGYTFTICLDDAERKMYRAQGRDYIDTLARAIHDSVPILEKSNSIYKGRHIGNEFQDEALVAIQEWRALNT